MIKRLNYQNTDTPKQKKHLMKHHKTLTAKLYSTTINRSYYASFYAIRAILALDGFDAKSHKSAIIYFNKNYIDTDIFPKELGQKLGQLKTMRESSDYDDFFVVTIERAEKQLNSAQYILSFIEKYLVAKYEL